MFRSGFGAKAISKLGKRGACPKVEIGESAEESIRSPPARITPPFRPRLAQREGIVREVAVRIYGRAPTTILVAASYGCRTVNRHPRRLSEHALGNAIDISGFRFALVPAAGFHASEDGFDVSIAKHWKRFLAKDPLRVRWGGKSEVTSSIPLACDSLARRFLLQKRGDLLRHEYVCLPHWQRCAARLFRVVAHGGGAR